MRWTLALLLTVAALIPQIQAPARALEVPISIGAGCQGDAPVAETQGPIDFTLRSGAYRLDFRHGVLRIGRPSAAGGLRLLALPGPDLDLLPHVTARTVARTGDGPTITLRVRATWATGRIELHAYAMCPGLFRWTIRLSINGAHPPTDPSGTDLRYVDAGGQPSTPATTLYATAEPSAAALTYLYDRDLESTLFYFADLTALNGLFAASGTGGTGGPFRDPRGGPSTLVGATAAGIGISLPPGCLSGIVAPAAPVTVADSYLYLGVGKPTTEIAASERFLEALGAVYDRIRKPVLAPADWRTLGARAQHDLAGRDVLVTLGNNSYLRAYVSDRRSAPELITQLNVLAGVVAYERTFGPSDDTRRLRTMLDADLPTFYAPAYRSVVNNLPLPQGPGAATESWYFIGDLINLARIARDGDAVARTLLLRSVPGAITLAHNVRYAFPRSITYGTWRGSGSLQPDVTGGYAYLMLQLHEITGDRRYLAEARIGLAHLAGYGFALTYETHMTALGAAAAARLSVLTGDRRLVDAALPPLANLFAEAWLWDCRYGACARGYHTFFGISPLPWSGYIAMMEQEETWQALREFALWAGDRAPAGVRTLVAEFTRYSLATLAYTLPTALPTGVAAAMPAEYPFVPRNRLDLAIPLEDLREGNQPSGQIGQEIYGAGGPLILAGLSSARIAPGLWVRAPYPFAIATARSGIQLTLAGTPNYRITLEVTGQGGERVRINRLDTGANAVLSPCAAGLCTEVAGGRRYLVTRH